MTEVNYTIELKELYVLEKINNLKIKMVKVILKKGREASLKRFHPWVFSGAIAQINAKVEEGDVVGVYDAQGNFLGAGHFQEGSIAVRILSFTSSNINDDFWLEALSSALNLRKSLSLSSSYRLVHGEGDNLPGLIIDYYEGVCVLQAHSVGMFRAKKQITKALQTIYGDQLKAVYDKSSNTAPFKAGLELIDGYIYRAEDFSASSVTAFENGHKFLVDWEQGQKTGFFLDQRNNRMLVKSLAKNRNVLNLFCYTGGFSIYALAGGASHVDSVDSSAKAIDTLEKNIELNSFEASKHRAYCEDAIDFLKNCPEDKYDLLIVDPPAFAKHRGALNNALRAYQRLNAAAISKAAKGSFIFTFSCSQVVDKEAFSLAIFSAAAQCGRKVRILDRLNQAEDHAVNIYHPEGEYLKGLLLYVE